jgi:glucose-6-phosphate isomerase
MALGEHRTFVQGITWDLNSFDQFGVELGKSMANQALADLHGNSNALSDGLLGYISQSLKS